MGVPAVSVIIPLYNAEKYVAECLDGILLQTFQDFELIIVDDCSTDKSVAIVESYREKFGGRLRLARTETNSGSGNLPRNIGLNLAGGEYIFFADADNFILLTALETLYAAAKEHDADVVYTAACYDLRKPNDVRVLRDGKGKDALKKNVDAKPELITNAPDKNLQKLFAENDFRKAWAKFVRRDLLTENEILFPTITMDGDYIWSVNVYCHAKKFLRLPTPLYFYRSYSAGRAAHKKRKPKDQISYWVSAFVAWLKALNELTNKIKFLRENPSLSYQASLDHFKYCLNLMSDEVVNRFYSKDTYEILLREFAAEKDSLDLIVPFFFSIIANREKLVSKTQKHVTKLEDEVTQQKKQIKSVSTHVCPAVSVIIPMYNAEKFIGEALDSILAQTLQSFEVIVVDDCSKDSSYKVVESYIPKFGGRLKLSRMEKNSGAAPAPRNKGFGFSRGEYIFFMDVDDVFTKTALEEMYTLAKDYDADVVYCEKYFMSKGTGQDLIKNAYPADTSIQYGDFVDKPTLISNDLGKRLQELYERKFWVTPWQRLVKRELLSENRITFPEIIGSDDVVWCFQVLCCAKRFLRVPNSCYIRRMYDESFTKSKKPINKLMHQWMDILIRGLKFADNFMERLSVFRERPDLRYNALLTLSRSSFNVVYPHYKNLPPEEIFNIFRTEFAKDTGNNDVLVSFLCTRVCSIDKELRDTRNKLKRADEIVKDKDKRIAELKAEIRRLQSGEVAAVTPAPVAFTSPAISVVVPMYNAEEFIGECLDSLLIQTFQDFEVIVADDCSTDNSVAVVESYAPKFNGRLKLTHTKKNSGGGGYIPRNLGLTLAGGEYVIFLDSDDFLLGTALETLYNAAKEYDADVVYSSTYYNVVQPDDVYLYRDGFGKRLFKDGVEDKTTLTVDDTDKIFAEFLASSEGNFRAPWSKFVRRDFLLQNEIRFPDIVTGGDCIWCINVYAYAKRFLRLPTPLYFYRRYNGTSITRTMRTPQEQLSYWVAAFIAFLKALNDLQSRTKVLSDNPNYCYEATRGGHFEWCLNRTYEARKELSNKEVYEILYRELGKEKDLFETAVPFFFAVIDNEKKNREEKLQTIKTLRAELDRLKKSKK